jgi:HEAT repeat protein
VETAVATVVGSVHEPKRIDLHGYSARLSVERVLAGEARAGSEAHIAWEELSTARPPRFEDGTNLLIALERLPATTIWRTRFPDASVSGSYFSVAAQGEAFLRNPDSQSVALLAGFLSINPSERSGEPGVTALAALVSRSTPVLAASALDRLDETPDLERRLNKDGAAQLLVAATKTDRPLEIRTRVLDLIGRRKLVVLRPALNELARPGSPLEAEALQAIAAIDGNLAEKQVQKLLQREEPRVRAVAARHVRGALAERTLPELARSDPAPQVRAAAARALAESGTLWGLEAALSAFSDTDSTVRLEAARAVGELGSAAVPALREAARSQPKIGAQSAVLALSLAGTEGRQALVEIAADHPDESIRKLAQLALGRLSGHEH